MKKPHIIAQLMNFSGRECWVFYVMQGYITVVITDKSIKHIVDVPGKQGHEAFSKDNRMLIQKKP